MAWGTKGHAIVADLAEAQLTPAAARAVARLLAVDHASHLSDVSSWADQAKADHLPGTPSHAVRMALDGDPRIAKACARTCALTAIDRYTKVLGDRTQPPVVREEALKYVVHLIGDIHQPLHDVAATGSKLQVTLDGTPRVLHWVWDNGIIDDHGGSARAIAAELARRPASGGAGSTPLQWALEGRAIAHDRIYTSVPVESAVPVVLPAGYARSMWPIVADRLSLAGARLAKVLNAVLG